MRHTIFPRKTFLLTVILAVLVAIFVIQERGGNRRNTVPIPEISGAIDQIRIVTADGELRFHRRPATADDTDSANGSPAEWTMGEEAYPVNPDALAAIEEQVTTLHEVDAVTSRGNPADYGLTADTVRTLRVFTGDLEPVAFQLGDVAAAGNAVYGRVNGGNEIVLLPKALDTAVALDPLRYREKTMAAVAEDEIVEVRITGQNAETVRVVRKITGENGEAADANASDAALDTNWQLPAPVSDVPEQPGASQLNALIRELGAVEATGFPEYDDPGADESAVPGAPFAGEPVASVVVERTDGSTVTIDLWPPVEERVPAAASTTPYRFYLPEWRARRLLLGVARFL